MSVKGKKKVKVKKTKKRSEVATTGIAESQATSNDPIRSPPFNPGGKDQEINTQD